MYFQEQSENAFKKLKLAKNYSKRPKTTTYVSEYTEKNCKMYTNRITGIELATN